MNYKDGLRRIRIIDPAHPLLPTLQQGETAINRMYMAQVLKDLPNPVPPKPPLLVVDAKNAYKELKLLYTKKNRTRNQYFLCKSDEERKAINRQLIQMRAELNQLYRRIEYYEKTGEFPAIPDVAPPALMTEDLAELHRLLRNARSNVSRYKSKIQNAYQEKVSKDIIEKLESKLKSFKLKKNTIEQKITLTETPGEN